MSEPTVPGVDPATYTTTPAQSPAEPTPGEDEAQEKVAPGTPGYSTYTGPPFADNPTKLPESAPAESTVGEG